jgi:single stranded DNA-binding protein
LTRDPKLVQTTGSKVVNFGIATNRFYKRSDGESSVESTYLDMEAWDSGAEKIAEIFKKGDPILVEASAKNSLWVDKDGVEQRKIVFRVSRFYPIVKSYQKDENRLEDWGKAHNE